MATRDLVARLREATYPAGDGKTAVMYDSGDLYAEACDLYAVLGEEAPSGSSNLENDKIRAILTDLQSHKPLSAVQYGVLDELLRKYSGALAKLRSSPDKDGQDFVSSPDPATARLVPAPLAESSFGRQRLRSGAGGVPSTDEPGLADARRLLAILEKQPDTPSRSIELAVASGVLNTLQSDRPALSASARGSFDALLSKYSAELRAAKRR
jgi:hypothetical protein